MTPVKELFAEAVSALRSRMIPVLVIVLVSLAVGIGTALQTAADLHQIQARHQQLLENGWGLITLYSREGGPLEAAACDAASEVNGVEQVGKIGSEHTYKALGIEAGLVVRTVSAETLKIGWPDYQLTSSPAYATGGFQKLHGLRGGTLYLSHGGAFTQLEVEALPATGRFGELDGQVLVVSQTLREVDYCLIKVDPLKIEGMALAIASATVSHSTIAVPATVGYELSPTPQQLLENYRSRQLPVLVPIALLLTAGLYQLLTRRDRAVYRLVGIRRPELWLMGLLQFTLLSVLPCLAGVSVLLAFRYPGLAIASEVILVDISTLLLANVLAGLLYATANASGRNTHQFAAG